MPRVRLPTQGVVVTRVWRVFRALRLRVTWIAVGYGIAFGMAVFGSKLHGLVEGWRTSQGASPDQRDRMRREKRSRVKAFDWVTDVGKETR
jgi:hypothetical protein